MHRFSNAFFAFSCFAFFGIPDAFAESEVHPFLTSKFTIQAGYYYPTQNVRLRVDGSLVGENNEFDFDEQINLPQKDDVFTLEMTWRFGKKWSLRMQHFKENRRRSAVLDTDIEWGDTVIQAGSSVFAGSNFKLARAFFGRAFDSNPKYDYGLGLGVHQIEIDAFIGEDIIINFGEVSSVSATGPLPNIGTITPQQRIGISVVGWTGSRCQSAITQVALSISLPVPITNCSSILVLA